MPETERYDEEDLGKLGAETPSVPKEVKERWEVEDAQSERDQMRRAGQNVLDDFELVRTRAGTLFANALGEEGRVKDPEAKRIAQDFARRLISMIDEEHQKAQGVLERLQSLKGKEE